MCRYHNLGGICRHAQVGRWPHFLILERRWPDHAGHRCQEQDKAKHASDILAGRDLALSVQVLQEFYVQATRASRPDPITHQQAVRLIESFRRFPVQDVTSAILMAALDTGQQFQLSYWDSATIEASRAMGCAEVLSENRGDGQDYAGIRVVNPFR